MTMLINLVGSISVGPIERASSIEGSRSITLWPSSRSDSTSRST